jgi:hypothetical protein
MREEERILVPFICPYILVNFNLKINFNPSLTSHVL